MSNNQKECRYGCKKVIEYRGKTGPKSTGFFEVDTDEEHTYQRCKNLLNEQHKEIPFGVGVGIAPPAKKNKPRPEAPLF